MVFCSPSDFCLQFACAVARSQGLFRGQRRRSALRLIILPEHSPRFVTIIMKTFPTGCFDPRTRTVGHNDAIYSVHYVCPHLGRCYRWEPSCPAPFQTGLNMICSLFKLPNFFAKSCSCQQQQQKRELENNCLKPK